MDPSHQFQTLLHAYTPQISSHQSNIDHWIRHMKNVAELCYFLFPFRPPHRLAQLTFNGMSSPKFCLSNPTVNVTQIGLKFYIFIEEQTAHLINRLDCPYVDTIVHRK
eukprot:TRINITY_DN56985_c0_g1_i1.p1 TRINITY_DN56985_c0_g1~~TRINITY_DN56985_c0_g1_i1.p1  ORF type:complete len:116 (+),score=0.66 TRINITY_DN56985_c0_g1_i1:26-349(+)